MNQTGYANLDFIMTFKLLECKCGKYICVSCLKCYDHCRCRRY